MNQHDFGICAKDMAESELNSGDTHISSSSPSNYDDLKSIGLLNVYRSSINPIQVGGLNLSLHGNQEAHSDETASNKTHPMVKVAWCSDSIRSNRNSGHHIWENNGSPSKAIGKYANASVVIRRRLLRRNRFGRRNGRSMNYLRFVLCVLYYMGVSPYRPKASWKPPRVLVGFLKMLHWTLVSIAILETLWHFKLQWIEFRKEPRMQSLSELGISLVVLITRIYTVKVFAAIVKKMNQLLDNSENTGTGQETYAELKFRGILAGMVGLSVSMALSSAVFGYQDFSDWSFGLRQRVLAYQMNEFLVVWTPNNWNNVTSQLIQKHTDTAVPMTVQTVILAMMGDTVKFTGSLYNNLSVDFWLALAYQVYYMQLDLDHILHESQGVAGDLEFEDAWDIYMENRIACDHIDEIFGPLLKLVHATNILRFSEFLLDIMEEDLSMGRVVCFVILLKIAVTYLLCKVSADMNGKMQKYVASQTDTNGWIQINGVKLKVYALRMEMDHHHIGLGRENFLVEETFLIKMLCAAWSVFALFADHSPYRR